MRRLLTLSKGDIRNITRDSMLLVAVAAPFILAVAMRLLLPFVRELLINELSFELSPYYKLIMSVLILITPMMMGMLSGFLILDERDDNILYFYSVTPLSKTGYLLYRISMPTVISFLLSFFVFYFIGVVHCRVELLIPVLLVCSLQSPMIALFLAAFAANKVEGLALTKAFGILFIAPVAGYFIRSGWQYTAGIAPTYWISKALFAAVDGSGGYWVYILIGTVMQLAIIGLLARRFENLYV